MNSKKSIMVFAWRLSVLKWVALGMLLFIFPAMQAAAANFNIKPVKIFFNSKNRIERLTLKNISHEILNLQLKSYQWTQDQTNQDVYRETKDLIIFPKILTLKQGEEKIVRIGINQISGAVEKSYRIYVKELPPVEKEGAKGSTVRMLLKIGVPVFISPISKNARGTIEMTNLKRGNIEFKVTNTGNIHFINTAIQVKGTNNLGKNLFSTKFGGWYLLSGSSKSYQTALPDEVCRNITRLDINVRTNMPDLTFKENVPVEKVMCVPLKETGKKDGS